MSDASRPSRSFRSLLVGEIFNKAARFAAAVALARSLTLEEFGLVNVGIAIAGIGVMATTLGLPEVGARDAAVGPEHADWLAGRVVTARSLVVAVMGAFALAVVALVDLGQLPLAALILGMALVPSMSLEWLLRGLDRMTARAVATALGGVSVLLGSVLLVPLAATPEVALAVFVGGEALAAALTWRAARLDALPRPTLAGLGAMLRRSWPVAISAFVVYSYYANPDTVIISATRSAEEAGLYSAPYRVFLALNTVAIFAAYAFLPLLARGIAQGRDAEVMARLRRSLLPLCSYGLIVVGVAEVAGSWLLGVLFGHDFESMRSVLILLCLAIPWYVVGYPVGYGLIARDANSRYLLGAGVAGGINLVLNLVLIPPYGPEGAAVATVAALAAGATVWLRAHGMFDLRMAPVIGLLLVVSLGAVLAAAAPGAATGIGVATGLVGAAGVLVWVARRIRAAGAAGQARQPAG